MILQVCVNGSRSRREHPAVPVTPDELARDVQALHTAGARSIHFHAHDAEGRESLEPAAVEAAVRAIRSACPDVELALSTADYMTPTPQQRLALAAAWTVLPDTVCINLGEPGSLDLARLAHDRGLALEAGIWTPGDVARFQEVSDLRWCRLLLEPESEEAVQAAAELQALEAALAPLRCELPRLIHGMNAATYPMLLRAARSSRLGRIGLEDTTRLQDGTVSEGNLQLYQHGLDLMRASG